MLTRIKIQGFKNLDLDVRLGPFTCIAGPNGIGKSNFFDAIAFLSALADKPLIDAALSVRGGAGRVGELRSLFRRSGESTMQHMSFLAEMIIPHRGEDALGQSAQASMTYLQYTLELQYQAESSGRLLGGMEILKEEMVHQNKSDARKQLGFRHSKSWRESAVIGRRTSPYISTEIKEGIAYVSLHTDSEGGGGGRPRQVPAASLPRTMLSSVNNAAEHRTLVLARQEMMSWTQLQLEPSALRSPDPFTAPHAIDAHGAHVPATLHYLAQVAAEREVGGDENVYARVSSRLAELIENVRSISVDMDEKRQLLNVVMTDLQGTAHIAGSLSDGTLRFLALTVMEEDPSPRALLCLEEPENGMHPRRIPAMIRLLQDLAVDPDEEVGPDNPLRQVIINTHSPSVVAEVPDDALLVARAVSDRIDDDRLIFRLALAPLDNTWRNQIEPALQPVARGLLLDYLNPLQGADETDDLREESLGGEPVARQPERLPSRRVKDRADLQMLLQFNAGAIE